jgi:putative adhesin
MSNQEMQFADPDWKPSQQLDEKASPQEQEAYRPQPINGDPREQQQWRAAQAAPPQQEGYTGLPPYAGVAPGQIQSRDYRQPQYRRRGRGPWLWIILAIILFSLMRGGFGSSFSRFDGFRHNGTIPNNFITQPQIFEVNGTPTVVISDDSGTIHVLTSSSPTNVTVQATNNDRFFNNSNDVQLATSRVGNTIKASVPDNGQGSADITVTVPQNSNLQLTTGSGGIQVNGIRGQMTLATNEGDVQMTNDALSGQSKIMTTDGDINFNGTIDTSGTYQFQSGSGSITVTVPGTSAFHLHALTKAGAINHNDFPGVIVQNNEPGPGSQANGDVGGNSQGQGPAVTITTGSGNISLNQQ